jgi:cell division septum initiation protein DivIVA
LEEEELAALISQTAALMEQFQQRTASADQRLQEIEQQLTGLTQQLPFVVKSSTDEMLQSIPSQIVGQAQGGLATAIADYEARWHTASADIATASKALTEKITRLEKLHRSLVWKISAVVITSLAILLGGAVWLATHYQSIISENQASAELTKAYNRADLALCNDGRLCANVDAKGKRYGEKSQYLPVIDR